MYVLKMTAAVVIFGALNVANAQSLSDRNFQRRLFNKCYAHLTHTRPSSKDPIYLKVVRGEISGAAGCQEFIESIKFGANGQLQNRDSLISRMFLRTVNDIHRSFFTLGSIMDTVKQDHYRTTASDSYDPGLPAYYFTRALMSDQHSTDSIFRGTNSLHAVRTNTFDWTGAAVAQDHRKNNGTGPYNHQPTTKYSLNYGGGLFVWTTAPFLPIGDMIGLATASPYSIGLVHPMTGTGPNMQRNNIPMYSSLGGGLLGDKTFLLMSVRRSDYDPQMDGGKASYRLWSRAVFEELLCRDTPAIRPSDSVFFKNLNSSIEFRHGDSCVQCHASLDPLSGAVRNVRYASTLGLTEVGSSGQWGLPIITTSPTNLGSESAWPSEPDGNFHRRPALGRLYYRNFDGQLVDHSGLSLAALGEKILEQDDFYVCTAKKYFKYFTGHDANLQDPGMRAALDSKEEATRAKVIELGRSLKQHKSLKQLILEIFSSSEYQEGVRR